MLGYFRFNRKINKILQLLNEVEKVFQEAQKEMKIYGGVEGAIK